MTKKINIWQKIFKGIEDGNQVFCGPHTAQIDLTDNCNANCIGCWVHSPLLDKKDVFPWGENRLPFEMVKRLIYELYESGTKEIILSGSGEPFLYPEIQEVIELIKDMGIYLNIITNASLINEQMAEFLIDKKVDLITASVWAATPETYIRTHPGKTSLDFEAIKENLKGLACHKRERAASLPYVKIYNVLCSRNYNDLESIVDFGRYVDSQFVEFQIVDSVKGKTDELVLDKDSLKKVVENLGKLSAREDMVKWDDDTPLNQYKSEQEDFGKIWKNFSPDFFVFSKGKNIACRQGNLCLSGQSTEAVLPPGQTQQTDFKFLFDKENCGRCEYYNTCFPSGNCAVNINLLSILGIKTFIRRISSVKADSGLYEQKINSLPCYIGWYYVRILTSGNVIPCCKAASHPLGNLYKASFSEIWNSPVYNEFRFNAKKTRKANIYFSRINCLKSCDNWGMNIEIQNRIDVLSEKKCPKTEEDRTKEIVIMSKDFLHGNFNAAKHSFGKNIIIDGGNPPGFAYYSFILREDGFYDIWSRYASNESRPVDIWLNRALIKKSALNAVTGGWTTNFLKWHKEFTIELQKGEYFFEIRSSRPIPHIEKFAIFKSGETADFIKKEEKISYFKIIANHFSENGLMKTLKKLACYLMPHNLIDRYLEILGLYDGEYGYKGPFHVQIDLTNNCNNNCIACWCNSPLLKERKLSSDKKMEYLPLLLVKELLDDISGKGAKEVYYSGSGEPFMHPDIMEILKYTKEKNLTCHVNTNFTLLDRQKLDCLMDIGVDFLTVSTWSGTAETYVRTHPGRTEDDFYKIRDNLIYLNTHKKDKPRIKLYNVIFNMNYFEVEKMVEFAAETLSESLEFTLIDTIPKATDILILDRQQLGELKESMRRIESALDKSRRVRNSNVLLFQFDQFLRRIYIAEDVKEAKYDRNIIDSMPCYIGWLFARIIPNGEFHSCLKSHRIPTGSLYRERFLEIWNSPKQAYFRTKTMVCKKDDPFFRFIGNDCDIKEAGCYKSCDDIGRNTWMHGRIKSLTIPEKLLLKGLTEIIKIARKTSFRKGLHKKYNRDSVIAGILHGRKAFAGPEQVVIDPTNKCNLKCAPCWLYSPFLTENKPSEELLKKELSKDSLIKLIDDLSSLGTKRIRFTGGGEPFMHKDLMEVIEYASQKKLLTAVTTNFGLVAQKNIKKLVELGVEELCVSIWASDADTYKKVHPDCPADYFERLKDNLEYLGNIKTGIKPRVTFSNVIMNTNYADFNKMYEFAKKYKADNVYFTLPDVFYGQTDRFLLNDKERTELLNIALEIKENNKKDNIRLEFFDGFIRRLSKSTEDFMKGEYDKADVDKIPCYAGWTFSRILADGSVSPCCRGVKKIMGNINENFFKNIWQSDIYNEFRSKAKFLPKDNNYFKDIGCVKECDNLMHNEDMYRRMGDA